MEQEEAKKIYDLLHKLQTQVLISINESKDFLNTIPLAYQYQLPYMKGAKINYLLKRRKYLKTLIKEIDDMNNELKQYI